MKTIGMAALLIFLAHGASASDFHLPILKYDQREPGSLPSAPTSGQTAVQRSWPEVTKVSKPRPISGRIDRDGIIVPSTLLGNHRGDLHNFDLIDPDYKLRVDEAPKIDQGMIAAPDAQRSGLTSR